MVKNKIGWCDTTWNPVFGCNNGCKYCYARKFSFRFAKEFGKIHGLDPDIFRNFEPVWLEKNFNKAIPKSATHIFVNSMSDPGFWKTSWTKKIWSKMAKYPNKKFIILTKDCGLTNCGDLENVYFGNTAGDNMALQMIPFRNPIVSIEPIFERIEVHYLATKKWVIVGAETGNRKEKIIPKAEWIEEIREFCQKNGIKYFEKESLREIVKRDLIQERI
jgi:protein gp37